MEIFEAGNHRLLAGIASNQRLSVKFEFDGGVTTYWVSASEFHSLMKAGLQTEQYLKQYEPVKSNVWELYIDGGASGNPGRGGWGVLVLVNGQAWAERYGAEDKATNNQMELIAAIEGLRLCDQQADVIIYSDSKYLVETMNSGWKRKKNHKYWKTLDEAVFLVKSVKFVWVRGHDGHEWQERAHELSMKAR